MSPSIAQQTPEGPALRRFEIEDLLVDLDGYEVTRRGIRIPFTHQEFELLAFFVQNRGRVFTRRELLSRVWGGRALLSSRTVDIHVYRLRTKLGPPFEQLIATVPRVGYKMVAEAPPRPALEAITAPRAISWSKAGGTTARR
jgi:two-component system alkaline phosphatase synthesis response regulator PhoP